MCLHDLGLVTVCIEIMHLYFTHVKNLNSGAILAEIKLVVIRPWYLGVQRMRDNKTEMDKSAYEKFFGGSEFSDSSEYFKKYVQSFLTNIDGRLVNLKLAIDENRDDDILNSVHQLKSSLRILGGNGISLIFEQLEKNLSHLTMPERKRLYDEAVCRTAHFKMEITEFSNELAA